KKSTKQTRKPEFYQWSTLIKKRTAAKPPRKTAKKPRKQPISINTPQLVLGREFLTFVICFSLLIISLQQIMSKNQPVTKPNILCKRGPTETSAHAVLGQKTPQNPLPQLPIIAWRGPVQPVSVSANPIPIITIVPVTEPVVFVTIDDGWVQLPENREW